MPKRKQDDFEDFNEFEDFGEDDFEKFEINSVRYLGRNKDGKEEEITIEGGSAIEGLPDMLKDLIAEGAVNALADLRGTVNEELQLKKEEEDRETKVQTIFETNDQAQCPELYKILLSVQRGNVTFGSYLCQSLANDLKDSYEDLLFGLTDNLYLHTRRSYTLCDGRICASTEIFWCEWESPYPLIIPNVADIVENEPLVYLIVGDMLEDLVSRVENNQPKKGDGGHSELQDST